MKLTQTSLIKRSIEGVGTHWTDGQFSLIIVADVDNKAFLTEPTVGRTPRGILLFAATKTLILSKTETG